LLDKQNVFVQLFLLNFQQNKLNMLKYTNIAYKLFSACGSTLSSKDIQILMVFSFIFTFGILHGANDLLLIKNTNDLKIVSFTKKFYYTIFL
jgi:hypothetical protein